MGIDSETYEAMLAILWPVAITVGIVVISAIGTVLEIARPEPWQRRPIIRR